MREINIDLSSDNHLQQPKVFGGYAGEHNETILKVKLPERMINIECSGYRFDFQTPENNKISSPLIPATNLSSGILTFCLSEQLTVAGRLLFNIVAILSNENDVSLIAKTNPVSLYIERSPDGYDVLIDINGHKDELLEMVDSRIAEIAVEQEFSPISSFAQSGTAVAEAISENIDNNKILDYIEYDINETDNTVTITGCDKSISGDYIIPDTIRGYPVITIGDNAFSECESLTGITIGNGVTSIRTGAFSKCGSLTSVTIPNSVTRIGGGAFAWCTSLTSITIPNSVTRIGNATFEDCESLKSITLPDSITTIWPTICYGCSNLISVIIPDSVTKIGDRAFFDCSSLTDVYYKGSQEQWEQISIGNENDSLTSATIHYNQDLATKEAVAEAIKDKADKSEIPIVDQEFYIYSSNAQSGVAIFNYLQGMDAIKLEQVGSELQYNNPYPINSNAVLEYIEEQGFEKAGNKVEKIEDGMESSPNLYTSTQAVVDYVNKQLKDLGLIIDQNYNFESLNAQSGKAIHTGVVEPLVTELNGKVDKTSLIAGIDLQDNITAEELGKALSIPIVDQTYSPNSKNAQSGKAVAGALSSALSTTLLKSDLLSEISEEKADQKCPINSNAVINYVSANYYNKTEIDTNKQDKATLNDNTVIIDNILTLEDNAEYRMTDINTLTLTYPNDNFECWLRISFAAEGDITVAFPASQYIGDTPIFTNSEIWEVSIKDGIVIAQKAQKVSA